MRYEAFHIRNFKGIKNAEIVLSSNNSVGVFAFVGLNESGKTTILEAIHSFAPESSTSTLVGEGGNSWKLFSSRVPRHLLSNFTGDISVEARLQLSAADKQAIGDEALRDHGITINKDSIPNLIKIVRLQKFSNGDF